MVSMMKIMDKRRQKDMLRRERLFFEDRLEFTRGPVELNEMIKEGQESKDRPNVVYCYSQVCQLSMKAAKYFVEHEFPTILLVGGIEEWKNNELPVET